MPVRIIAILVLGSLCASAGTILLKLGATGRIDFWSFINPMIITGTQSLRPGSRVLDLWHVTAKPHQRLSVHNSKFYDSLLGRDYRARRAPHPSWICWSCADSGRSLPGYAKRLVSYFCFREN